MGSLRIGVLLLFVAVPAIGQERDTLKVESKDPSQVSSSRASSSTVWSKRDVVLKKPVYDIAYDSPSGQAITTVSPDKGSYFHIQVTSTVLSTTPLAIIFWEPILDRDPEQLLNKVAVRLASPSVTERELGLRPTVPKLLTFKTGTKFRATARFLEPWSTSQHLKIVGTPDDRKRLAFDLYDDLDDKDIATILWVHWPTELSPEFAERAAIEKLIAEFFDW